MSKRMVVRAFVNCTHGWNTALHDAIEERVVGEHHRLFPGGTDNSDEEIRKMREFYYARMATTANLLIAGVALFVSFASLIVSAIALHLNK